LINTQWLISVSIDFSLVSELSNSFSRHWIVVRWLEWHIWFKIKDLIRINEVVFLLIHAFANVVFRFFIAFNILLKHWNFYVIIEVPNHHYHNFVLYVFGYNLQLMWNLCVIDFDDLNIFVKIKLSFNKTILCLSIFVKHRFIKLYRLDVSAILNKQEVIVIDRSTKDITFPKLNVFDLGIKLFNFMIFS